MHQTSPQFGGIHKAIIVLYRQNRFPTFGLIFVNFVVRVNVARLGIRCGFASRTLGSCRIVCCYRIRYVAGRSFSGRGCWYANWRFFAFCQRFSRSRWRCFRTKIKGQIIRATGWIDRTHIWKGMNIAGPPGESNRFICADPAF